MNLEQTPRLEAAIKSLLAYVPSNLPEEVAIKSYLVKRLGYLEL